MEYTLYQVSTLSSRTGDTKVESGSLLPVQRNRSLDEQRLVLLLLERRGCSSTQTNVTNARELRSGDVSPWVSALKFTPTNSFDRKMFKDQFADNLAGTATSVTTAAAT